MTPLFYILTNGLKKISLGICHAKRLSMIVHIMYINGGALKIINLKNHFRGDILNYILLEQI